MKCAYERGRRGGEWQGQEYTEAAERIFDFLRGWCDEVLHEIFRFPWFSVVLFCSLVCAGSNERRRFFGYFQSFLGARDGPLLILFIVLVRSLLQEHSNFFVDLFRKHVDIFEKIQRVKSSGILLSAIQSVAAVTAADNDEGCKSGIRGMFQNRGV